MATIPKLPLSIQAGEHEAHTDACDTANDAASTPQPICPPIVLMLTNGDSSDNQAAIALEVASPAEAGAVHEGPAIAAASPESQTLHAGVIDPASTVASPEPTAPKRRKRGADPALNNLWPRHHARGMFSVIGDLTLGGYGAFRTWANPLKDVPAVKNAPDILLGLCPWILNAAYLNFEGSVGLAEKGLNKCYAQWAGNRLYFLYRPDSRNEHPTKGGKAKIGKVYRQFYDTFSADVAARTPISEERARAFWLSVSDRVPFKSPVRENRVVPVQVEVAPELAHPNDQAVTAYEGPAIPTL